MSRQAHLPPRCPLQKKPNVHPVYDPVLSKDIPLYPRHHRSVSQSYLKQEQPAWLDDLLVNPESVSSGIMHRRSASDSSALLDDLVSLTSLNRLNTLDTSCKTDGTLKSDSMYGPNSPRGKGNLTFPENSIISALSEYARDKHFQNLDEESFSTSRVDSFRLAEDTFGPTGEGMVDTQAMKRHPGQRSRVRKLQYIAELENTVDILQKTESDLAARVASLLQKRLSLSVENNQLKQELIKLQQHKLFVDGQNQTLRKEFEVLKVNTGYGGKKGGRNSSLGISSTSVLASSGRSWPMLDIGKLNLS